MLQSLTGDDIYAEIIMLRTSDPRTILLMEGDSDCGALDPHIDEREAYTLPGHSKTAVERAVGLVDSQNVERVLGIVDRDWIGKLERPNGSANLIYTDAYDLDATIIFAGDVLDRVLSSIADRVACTAYLARVGVSAGEVVTRLAGVVGLGRYVSVRDRLQARFERFPIHQCIDHVAGEVDIARIGVIAIQRAKAPTVSEAELANRVRAEQRTQGDLADFCNGHDLAVAISSLVQKSWGGGAVSGETVEKICRAAFSCENLKQTALYRKVEAWANQAATVVWSCV